ncbi:MAG: 5-oxoprolinase subunit PxpB [Thermoflexales bacterium]
MQTTDRWRFDPLGEAAVLATYAETDMDAANRAAVALAEAITRAALPGVGAVVPAIDTVLVAFDPLHISRAEVEGVLRALTAIPPSAESTGRDVVIAVRFGGAEGPDLPEVAATLGLSETGVIQTLCERPIRVLMVGYAPGWPYLGPLPAALTLPRRATPRAAIPPGSVAIAAGMAGIYPARLPGGWHLIGRTDALMFDPSRETPSLLRAGDRVRFQPA